MTCNGEQEKRKGDKREKKWRQKCCPVELKLYIWLYYTSPEVNVKICHKDKLYFSETLSTNPLELFYFMFRHLHQKPRERSWAALSTQWSERGSRTTSQPKRGAVNGSNRQLVGNRFDEMKSCGEEKAQDGRGMCWLNRTQTIDLKVKAGSDKLQVENTYIPFPSWFLIWKVGSNIPS